MKYAKFFKYTVIPKIHNKEFHASLLNKLLIFLTPIDLYTFNKNTKMHTNPDFNYNYFYDVILFIKLLI